MLTCYAEAELPPSAFEKFLEAAPQEILDMIFDYAYPGEHMDILSKRSWEKRERDRRCDRGRQYQVRPFPQHKVDDFFVFTTFFFRNAARAYVGNRHWSTVRHLMGLIYRMQPRGMIFTYVASLEIYGHELNELVLPPRPRTLIVHVAYSSLPKLASERLPWFDALDEQDFQQVWKELRRIDDNDEGTHYRDWRPEPIQGLLHIVAVARLL